MSTDRIITERVVSAMFDQNAYLVWKHGETKAVAIDPGFDVESLISLIHSNQLTLAAIWLTHGHADHIMGLERLKKAFPDAPIVIGVNEAALLTDPELNLSSPMGFPVVAPKADRTKLFAFPDDTLLFPGHGPSTTIGREQQTNPYVGDGVNPES